MQVRLEFAPLRWVPYNANMVQRVKKAMQVRDASASKWRRHDGVSMAGEADAGSEAVAPDIVGMVPPQILQEDEVVLLLTKPSLFFIFYSSFIFILFTLVIGAILAQIAKGATAAMPSPSTIMTLMAAVCAGRIIWALLV